MEKVFDARLRHPFSLLLSGPSQCGKSTFILNLLKNSSRLIDVDFDYIVCFLGSDDPKLYQLETIYGPRITFVKGLPDNFDAYIDSARNGFFVIDDLMRQATEGKHVAELFTKKCHHENISVALILQNFFYHAKERQTILRSAHYLAIFRNPLDQSVIYSLAHRIDPMHKGAVIKTFLYAQERYRYLFVDGKQESVPEARFRSDIFNTVQRCFIPLR